MLLIFPLYEAENRLRSYEFEPQYAYKHGSSSTTSMYFQKYDGQITGITRRTLMTNIKHHPVSNINIYRQLRNQYPIITKPSNERILSFCFMRFLSHYFWLQNARARQSKSARARGRESGRGKDKERARAKIIRRVATSHSKP